MEQKVNDMLAEFAKARAWGSIVIEIQNGVAVRIRKETIEKLNATENNRADEYPSPKRNR